ncbi:peptidase S24/S26A/S26B/S26C, partial [Ochromonadaceae sp. CCMP2298]
GPSMLPTIDHNLVFVDRFSHRIQGKDYKVGDVVLSEFLVDLSMRTDRMAFYPENSETCSIVTVPPGHVWLLGDNCENSLDSRAYGAVPVGMLRGRVFSKM